MNDQTFGVGLAANGKSKEAILAELKRLHDIDYEDVPLRAGQLTHWALGPHAVPNEDYVEIAREAAAEFVNESQFYVKRQPSLKRFHEDITAFVLGLHDAPEGAAGSVTMGGTESNILAMKAARDRARAERPEITEPEVVLPRTAHPSFVKGAELLCLKLRRPPAGDDFRADVAAMADAINENTIMLVGSAPTYPHGAIDPIDALSDLALKHGLWLHVDSCVGGIIGPFMRELDPSIPTYGFDHPGVTSLSADLHKHGYAPIGVSTISYRDADLLKYQEFVFDDWPNGLHVAPVIVGSRPANGLAGAWATMQFLGHEGYLGIAQRLIDLRDRMITGVRAIPGLEVYGEPRLTMFGFGATDCDSFAIGDALTERGWNVHRLAEPRGLHLIVDPFPDDSIVDDYLSDLAAATREVQASNARTADEKVSYG